MTLSLWYISKNEKMCSKISSGKVLILYPVTGNSDTEWLQQGAADAQAIISCVLDWGSVKFKTKQYISDWVNTSRYHEFQQEKS